MVRELQRSPRASRTRSAFALAFAGLVVAGCGIKGPLKLPDPPATAVPPAASAPAPDGPSQPKPR